MCRYTAIISSKEAIVLGDIVTRPKLSIIYQSFNCHERIPRDEPRWAYEKSTLNGDGVGVGWYPCKEMAYLLDNSKLPCVFTSLKPAWGDRNLRQIAEKTASPLIFAHVRAAGPGSGPPTEANCHPFAFGRFLFMHNGVLGDWRNLRRELLSSLRTERAFDYAMENNPIDSVLLFALFIDQLDPKRDEYTANELRAFLERVIQRVCHAADKLKVDEVNYINCCVSDGVSIVASRFALGPYSQRVITDKPKRTSLTHSPLTSAISDFDEGFRSPDSSKDFVMPPPPYTADALPTLSSQVQRRPDRIQSLSLYFATGTRWVRDESGHNDFKMVHRDKRNHVCIITSEPLTDIREEWVPVPHNSLVVVTANCDVLLQPLTPALIWSSDTTKAESHILDILSAAPLSCRMSLASSKLGVNTHTPRLSSRSHVKRSSSRPSIEALNVRPAAIARSLQSLEGRQIESILCVNTPSEGGGMPSESASKLGETDGTITPLALPVARHSPLLLRSPRLLQTTHSASEWQPKGPKHITCRRILTQSKAAVLCMAEVICDGKAYVFAGDEAGYISLWSLDLAVRIVYLAAHKGSVLALQPYIDATEGSLWLFSASSDTTVCMWDVSKMLECRSIDVHCTLAFLAIRLRFEPIQGDVLSLTIQRCKPPGVCPNSLPDDFLFMGYQSTLIGFFRIRGLSRIIRECTHLQQLRSGTGTSFRSPDCQIADHIRKDEEGALELVLSANTLASGTQWRPRPGHVLNPPCMIASTAIALGVSLGACEPYVYGIPAQKDAESTAVSDSDHHVSTPENGSDLCLSDDSGTDPLHSPCCQASLDWYILTPSQSALQHHCGFIECLEVSGDYLLSGGGDGLILVWKDCKHVTTLSGHSGGVLSMVCDDDVAYSGSRDHSIRVWDIHSLSCRQVLRGHTSDVMTLAMTSALLLSASTSHEIFGWSRKWNEIHFVMRMDPDVALPNSKVYLTSLLRLADETTVLSSGGDGIVGVWDISGLNASANGVSPHDATVADTRSPTSLYSSHVSPASRSPLMLLPPGEGVLRKVSSLLETLIPMRSLSGSPVYLPECWRTAKFIELCLQDLGAETQLHPTSNATAPIVMGRFGNDPTKPTVILYSHYDVVSSGEDNLGDCRRRAERQGDVGSHWSSCPWALTCINSYFCGRGVTDNKGPLAVQLVAIAELLNGNYDAEAYRAILSPVQDDIPIPRGLPLNIIFISEGEEESGSQGFESFLTKNMDMLKDASYAIFTNSYWLDDERPCLVHGMRGVIDVQVSIMGGDEPLGLHSGIHGGAVAEPLADLVGVIGNIVDSQGFVNIPGFYDDVLDAENSRSPSQMSPATEYRSTCSTTTAFDLFDVRRYREETKSAGLRKVSSRKLLQKRWLEPVLSITEIWTSAQHGSDAIGSNFRILPSVAGCNISVRLVPYQRTEDIVEKMTRYVKFEFAKRNSPNTIETKVLRTHDWWQGDTASPLFTSAARAVEHVWAIEPLCIREGGTMPIIRQLQDTLHAATIQIPIGQASDNAHLPNERLKFVNIVKGVEVLKMTMFGIGLAGTNPMLQQADRRADCLT